MRRHSDVMSLITLLLIVPASYASAATPERMAADCRSRGAVTLRTRLPNIETKYEGQRTDGTHAVNGIARFNGQVRTFQCSFNARGFRILRFAINRPSESAPTVAADPARMMAQCRSRAGQALRTRLPNIETKYEGQRVDGTHAVNGTALSGQRAQTFQCSFDAAGRKVLRFVSNPATVQRPTQQPGDALVPGTLFNATGDLNCARAAGQPMASCRFGVVRKGVGAATVTVFWPDGGKRVITFEGGRPVSYDRSQADGSSDLTFARNGDMTVVTIGGQRFEIVDAIVSGG